MPDRTLHVVSEISEVMDKIGEKGDSLVSKAKTSTKVVKAITATQAFRKHSWLNFKPVMNASGNLRGMVVNARARAVYDLSIKGQDYIEKAEKKVKLFQNIAAVVHALVDVSDETIEIIESNDDNATKSSKLAAQVTSAALRTITGVLIVPEVMTYAQTLATVSRFAGNYMPAHKDLFENVAQTSDEYAASVKTTFQTFTDGNNIYHNLQTVVVPYWFN